MSPDSTEQVKADSKGLFKLRVAVLFAAGVGTLLLIAAFIPVIRLAGDARADGFHMIAAFFAMPIYGVFVLPALILGFIGERLGLIIAAVLLAAGAVVAAVIFQ